jgi:hypothetical protein
MHDVIHKNKMVVRTSSVTWEANSRSASQEMFPLFFETWKLISGTVADFTGFKHVKSFWQLAANICHN